ncbi:MAG: ATP synthase F1 subunit epsilon [Ruminococcus sp.]|nr:ATP synthase F1 subunit epsilon [Ruminococcus sp.]
MATFKLRIVTPEKVFFEGDVTQIITTTAEGNIGVMAGHVPYVANIVPSALKIKVNDTDDFHTAAVSGGFVNVSKDETIVVTSAVEWAEDIDVVRAQHAKEVAERRIKENASKKEFERAEQKLKRAVNRLSVSKK